MSKNQFLIVGANFINKGAEAMLKTIQLQIRQRNPDAEIYAICHPQEREIAKRQGIHPITDQTPPLQKKIKTFTGKVKNKLGQMAGNAPIPYADFSPMEEIIQLKNLTMAVDVSGFAYGDKRGYLQPLETQKVIDYCKKLGAKYIFMPQAWGSFKEAQVAVNCKKMIESGDAYFTRDEVSRKFVADLLGQPVEQVPLLPDIAFHFPIPEIDGAVILKKHGYTSNSNREKVCLSPNMRIYERMDGTGTSNAYVTTFIDIIYYLRDSYDIVLIPNEIMPDPSAGRDDQFLCKLIFEALDRKEHVTCISGYYSAEEIKSVIRECDFVIASRFHSLVFALSLGIPSMAISWSHKYRELFRLFALDEFVLEDKGILIGQITNTFEKLVKERGEVTNKINTVLPQLKAANAHVFELLKA